MEPKIFAKGAFLVAGVAGSGDETGKVWEAFMKLEKMNPLKNQVGEAGYEIRMYPSEEEPGKVHVGVQVKNSNVPKEYKLFFVPAAIYAEFKIYPARGFESSNAEMSKWLEDNAITYKQALLDGMYYGIEVYDKRYKGNDNPESVVGFLEPIVKVDPDFDISKMVTGPLEELAGRIEQFAGTELSKKVMKGKDEIIASKDPVKGALWMKEAIDRLDALTDKDTRLQIMTACGRSCNAANHKDSEEARQLRLLCSSEEDFLAMMEPPGNGVRYDRNGDTLVQYYTPGKFRKGLRCYCSLVNGLPGGVNASPTYCQCARAFTEQHWGYVLGRPVKVELGETVITGSDECKFIINLK